ncbi:MAG: helix-turn-helix domain-containing protein [Lachnospiraceae bacterium]|nr:helix-turn-helix domain-containing protein [Lachnospiraceae bacterium]
MQILIGEKLLTLRTQKNMTQEELAERLGVTRQSVSKWESNGTFPNMNKLLEICDIFQVSLDYLLRDIDEQGNKVEVQQESQLPPVTEYPPKAAKKRKPVSIYMVLSMILVGILFLISCWLFGSLSINHIWNAGDREQKLMHVDTIYEQYTKARVTVTNEEWEFEDRVLWLDVDGVKENDWVFCYTTDSDGVRVKYTGKTLMLPGLMALVFFFLFILLYMELRRNHASEAE